MKKKSVLLLILIIPIIVLTAFLHQSLNAQVFWEERISGVTESLNSVHNFNVLNAWICGDSGTVLHTTDRGYNWHNVSGGGWGKGRIINLIINLSNKKRSKLKNEKQSENFFVNIIFYHI